MSFQDYTRPSITFYMDKVYHSLGASCKYPTIYIMAYIDSKGVKRVMIDEGSVINVVFIAPLQHLNIPLSYFSAPTLAIKAFNNILSTTLGMVILPLKVVARLILIVCHVL